MAWRAPVIHLSGMAPATRGVCGASRIDLYGFSARQAAEISEALADYDVRVGQDPPCDVEVGVTYDACLVDTTGSSPQACNALRRSIPPATCLICIVDARRLGAEVASYYQGGADLCLPSMSSPVLADQVRGFLGRRKTPSPVTEVPSIGSLDLFPDLVQQARADGRITYVNRAWLEALGYDSDEALRLTIFDVVDLDHHDACRRLLDDITSGRRRQARTTLAMRRYDGTPLVVEGRIQAGSDADGSFTIGTFREQDPQGREAERLALAAVSIEVQRMVGPDDILRVLSVVGEALDRLEIPYLHCGFNYTEQVGGEWTITHYTADQNGVWTGGQAQAAAQDVLQRLADMKVGDVVYRSDLAQDDPYDEWRRFRDHFGIEIRSVVDVSFGGGTLAVNTSAPHAYDDLHLDRLRQLADVLGMGFRRLRDLRHLVESEERYRTLVESTHFGVLLVRNDGTLDYVSPMVERLTGHASSDILDDARLALKLVEPSHRRPALRALRQALKRGTPSTIDFAIRQLTGERAWLRATLFPIAGRDGIAQAQVLVRDVTEQRRTDEALRLQAELLAERERLATAYQEIGAVTLRSLDIDTFLDSLGLQVLRAGIFRSLMIALCDDTAGTVSVVRNLVTRRNATATLEVGQLADGASIYSETGVVGLTYPLDSYNVTARVARTGQGAVIRGWDPAFDDTPNESYADKVSYFIPVAHAGTVMAVLATASSTAEEEDTRRRIEIMGPLLDLIAVGLSHIRTHADQREQLSRERLQRAVLEMTESDGVAALAAALSHELAELGQTHTAVSLSIPEGEPHGRTVGTAGPDVSPHTTQQTLSAAEQDRLRELARTGGARAGAFPTSCEWAWLVDSPPATLVECPCADGVVGVWRDTDESACAPTVHLLERVVDVLSLGVRRYHDLAGRRHAEMVSDQLEGQVEDLELLYQLRVRLEGHGSPADVVDLAGNFLAENLRKDLSLAVEITYAGATSRFGSPQATRDRHSVELVWADRSQGFVRVFDSGEGDPISAGLLEAACGQISQVLEARELHMQLVQSARLVSLGEMAAGVAHELSQPLAAMSAAVESVQLRAEQGIELSREAERRMWSRVSEMVRRMVGIIDHLRLFSRDWSQEKGVPFTMNDAVSGSLDLIGAQLRNRGIDVRVELDPDLPPVVGHLHQMEQVVLNLLANARDALDDRETAGGGATWTKRLWIRTRVDDRRVVAEVEDEGAGIDDRIAQRLFEPFFTTKEPDRGTGLGLAIAYAITRSHGGQMTFASRPERGTVFRISVPAESIVSSDGGATA